MRVTIGCCSSKVFSTILWWKETAVIVNLKSLILNRQRRNGRTGDRLC
ncbi:MAG: hypothetical protein GY943_02620 [Chloroflexi bacterium]|nr:hypothetical protein [Chloroflexota bacterium]